MELGEIILTQKEIDKAMRDYPHTLRPYETVISKAQCLKLLEWLVKERIIEHENYTEFKDYEKNFKNWHKPDCQVCALMEALRG